LWGGRLAVLQVNGRANPLATIVGHVLPVRRRMAHAWLSTAHRLRSAHRRRDLT
jgi:hypothetical protein